MTRSTLVFVFILILGTVSPNGVTIFDAWEEFIWEIPV